MNQLRSQAIRGAAGTSKSSYLRTVIRTCCDIRDRFLSLTYNVLLTKRQRENQPFPPLFTARNTMTIHALAHFVLKKLNLLPAKFQGVLDPDHIDNGFNVEIDPEHLSEYLKIKGEDYTELLLQFCRLSKSEIQSVLGDLKVVAIDEFQDANDRLLDVIIKLRDVYDCPFLIAGDPFQQINTFGGSQFTTLNGKEDIMAQGARLLGLDDIITLNENRRSSSSISAFINGFMIRVFGEKATDYLYTLPPVIEGAKPEIHLFSTTEEESQFLQDFIPGLENAVILCRKRKSVALLESLGLGCKIETISRYKGLDADTVILSHYALEDNSNDLENMINNVGLTRAKKRLIITSSFPESTLLPFFEPGTYELHNHQKRGVPRYQTPPPMVKEFTTLIQYNRLSFDSIAFSIHADHVPFLRYVQHDGQAKNISDNRRVIATPEGLSYTLMYHHSSRRYFFKFMDLNILHYSGYTDTQALRYLRNIIFSYFDHRIDPVHIDLAELHVFRVRRFRSNIDRVRYLNSISAQMKKVRVASREIVNRESFTESDFERLSSGGYFNLNSKNSVGFVVYDPKLKDNDNRFPDDEYCYAKAELRLRTRADIQQVRFLNQCSSMASFMKHVADKPDWSTHIFRAANGFDPEEILTLAKAS